MGYKRECKVKALSDDNNNKKKNTRHYYVAYLRLMQLQDLKMQKCQKTNQKLTLRKQKFYIINKTDNGSIRNKNYIKIVKCINQIYFEIKITNLRTKA